MYRFQYEHLGFSLHRKGAKLTQKILHFKYAQRYHFHHSLQNVHEVHQVHLNEWRFAELYRTYYLYMIWCDCVPYYR